eukprot:2186678-Amphidinium_carterae.1
MVAARLPRTSSLGAAANNISGRSLSISLMMGISAQHIAHIKGGQPAVQGMNRASFPADGIND